MMPCPPSSGGHTAPLLVSLAFGYAVLVLAKRESKPLNVLGKWIGWLIIAVSFSGLICTAICGLYHLCPVYRSQCAHASVGCPFGGPRADCGMSRDADGDDDDDGDAPHAAMSDEKK